jgi:hypothetical protein
MLKTPETAIAEARLEAAYAAQKHMRRHGASLCDLLDALDDPAGIDALCDLHSASGQPIPDVDAIETAVSAIHRVLAEQAPSSLDRIGVERCLPASDLTRWHGARISELLNRFLRAG